MKKIKGLILLAICISSQIVFGQPGNDDPCNAYVLPVTNTCTYSTFDNTGATDSPGVPAPGCANYGGSDVWFEITVPASGNVQIDFESGGFTDGGAAAYSGTCGALGLVSCNDDGGTGLMPQLNLTAQTPGNSIWIRVWEYGGNSFGEFGICANDASATSPANDEPCTATPIGVNASCVDFTSTNVNATGSTPSGSCAFYNGGDVWFSFTVPASGEITATGSLEPGGFNDGGMELWSGDCGNLTSLGCNDDSGPGLHPEISLTGLTPGETIYIQYWEFGNNSFGEFNICVVDDNPPPPPANDDPCSAQSLSVANFCSFSTFTNEGATATTLPTPPAPGCADYQGGDVWFSFVVPATGAVNVNTNTGTMTDGGMALYSGLSCNALTLISCDDNSSSNGLMPFIEELSLTPGATIWIRMWEFGNNNNGTFDICVQEVGPCGNPLNNDYCDSPATLTQGTGSWSSTTSGVYSADLPANVNSEFCGSIENNSWYQFTALSTTEDFPITNVFNCTTNSGIQGEVYEVTNDANGCCTNFTSFSNCYNPGNTTLGTISATGLTIGNQYILMIDGFGGDDCDFTVSGWTAENILPIELIKFNGIALSNGNDIRWTTASERNNSYFELQRSTDGIEFETIANIEGAGTTSIVQNYQFLDKNPGFGVSYYRLLQFDFDGTLTTIDPISLAKYSDRIEIIRAYPNPTDGELNIELSSKELANYSIVIHNQQGVKVYSENIVLKSGLNKIVLDNNFAAGLYTCSIINNNMEILDNIKYIRK